VYRTTMALMATLALTAPATAHATALGVQDDGQSSQAVSDATNAINGTWTRTIAHIGQPGIADRIRDVHSHGQKIILTVGGTGTTSRRPNFKKALVYIATLPRADRYTIGNEPNEDRIRPCSYRRQWMDARTHLGSKLLLGDLSPWDPLDYMAAVRKCGRLPKHVGFALHPYCWSDPLAPCFYQGGIGNLGHVRRVMRAMGITVDLWLDEFGYRDDDRVGIPDAVAAWMWPRAIRQAVRNRAKVLIAFTSHGKVWNTRPGPLAWCSLTLGRACPGAVALDHRKPVEPTADSNGQPRQENASEFTDDMASAFDY
jgi:hypothetical protein